MPRMVHGILSGATLPGGSEGHETRLLRVWYEPDPAAKDLRLFCSRYKAH